MPQIVTGNEDICLLWIQLMSNLRCISRQRRHWSLNIWRKWRCWCWDANLWCVPWWWKFQYALQFHLLVQWSWSKLSSYERAFWSFIIHWWIHKEAPNWRSIWWSLFIPMSQYIQPRFDHASLAWLDDDTWIMQIYYPVTTSMAEITYKICGIANGSSLWSTRATWHPNVKTNSSQEGVNDGEWNFWVCRG